MSSTTSDAGRSQSQTARRVASIAADLRRHQSSATFVASSLFLASQPRSTQRGHGGFRMSSRGQRLRSEFNRG